jgi:hypothetical protein
LFSDKLEQHTPLDDRGEPMEKKNIEITHYKIRRDIDDNDNTNNTGKM